MVFTDHLIYERNKGFRTAPKALPFLLLGGINTQEYGMVGLDGLKSNQLFEELENWEEQCKRLNICDILDE